LSGARVVERKKWEVVKMENEWVTVSELTNTGIPISTIRRYIQTHPTFLQSKKIGKKILLHKDSIKLLELIRSMYVEGNLTGDEIEERLIDQGVSRIFTVQDDTNQLPTERSTINQALETLMANQQETNERLEQQDQELKAIKESLQRQEEFNKLLVEKLDNRLMEQIRSIQELKQSQIETAATTPTPKKWWEFWK